MALHHYLVNSRVVLIGTCDVVDPLTDDKTPTDPTTVTFTRKKPDGTISVYIIGDAEVSKLAVGIWACTVTVDQVGREVWQYAGTGSCHAVAEDAFEVNRSAL